MAAEHDWLSDPKTATMPTLGSIQYPEHRDPIQAETHKALRDPAAHEQGGACLMASSLVTLTIPVLHFAPLIYYPQLLFTDCLGISKDGEIKTSKWLLSVKSNTRNWTTFAKQDLATRKTKRGWEKGRSLKHAKIKSGITQQPGSRGTSTLGELMEPISKMCNRKYEVMK